MRNNYLFLVSYGFLLSFAHDAQAQTNFRPGYVLPLAGDTLHGEVDSREGRLNAQRARFRTSAEAPVTTYSPAELKGYGLTAENRHYRSLPVAVGGAASKPYFLEILVDGPASLFFMRDSEQREMYYVASAKLPLAPLEHGMQQEVKNGQTYMREQKTYRNMLAAALAGCPVVQGQLPRLPFQENALRKIVSLYNSDCAGYQPLRPQPGATTTHVTWGLMAGAVQHRLSYTGFPYKDGETTHQTHSGLAVGPVFQVSSSRVSQRLSLGWACSTSPKSMRLKATVEIPTVLLGSASATASTSLTCAFP
ncbi:hypothetical protein ACFQT0_11120 [Hymenobacter humi]|uniref:Uncharacterized protein n=1 Tax=Hymenobacter humi TaxID=1411620 RepID=A0ABW2U6D5_9BACT